MNLFRDVMDKELDDCDGDKMGKVDDILLELRPDGAAVVRAIVMGPGSLSPMLPSFLARLGRWIEERLLGSAADQPIEIPWEKVMSIDVVVKVDVDRHQVGATHTEEALWDRFISPLPWSRR
ncbi:MAG TPA: hypothetical protein VFB58_03295 [Chloroflexota bacterium]|nr:hypothetical protein [Chloroflexota bacterium]